MAVSIARDVPQAGDEHGRGARLGLDQPAGWWPTAARLKSYEAAGFEYVQVRMPPGAILDDRASLAVHAAALREALALTGLRLVLHAPDELLAGDETGDRRLAGAVEYAAIAGAEVIVYHGLRVAVGSTGAGERLRAEERTLRRLAGAVAASGTRLAIENLAPVYRGGREYVCHDPGAVHALVQRLDREQIGICLDLGHAQIAAELAGRELLELVEPVLERVILFHVHDNFGARLATPRAGGIEPLKLDLHLSPGAGTVPWRSLQPLLANHHAPLQLEVHPARRPEAATLAVLAREVLGVRAAVRRA